MTEERRPIFYDTETTGLKAESERIIEIAAYDPVRDATFHTLVKPDRPIPKEASAVHHITDDMVAQAPLFEEVLPKLVTFCEGEVMLVAHNNDGFDIHFLREEFGRCDQTLPEKWAFFDTLKWARRYRSDLPRHSLAYLGEIYGIDLENTHRALDDVLLLQQVYLSLVDDLTPNQALDLLLQKEPPLTVMPFGKFQGTPLGELPQEYLTWLTKSGALEKEGNSALKAGFILAGRIEDKGAPSP